MKTKYLLLAIFIIGFFIYGCAKKSITPIETTPSYNQTNATSIFQPAKPKKKKPAVSNATVFPNGTVTSLELPVESAKKVFNETEKQVTQEKVQKKKQMDLWTYWRKYGRSTPPLLAIFFDFNKYNIRKDMWDRIKKNAVYLLLHPKVKIELQGNCDERGTNEYNLALGAKRALEVKKVLVALGIKSSRIFTVSFGEERPLAKCHNETCWSINRRVDFVIIK